MKKTRSRFSAGFAIALLGGSIAQAGVEWSAANGKWEDASNWTGGVLPGASDDVLIKNNGTNNFDAASGNVDVSRIFVAVPPSGHAGVLNVSGGRLRATRSGATVKADIGRAYDGTINVSGGELNFGHRVRVGSATGGQGEVNLTGGSLIISRAGNSEIDSQLGAASLDLGDDTDSGADSPGILNISGGTFQTRQGVVVGGLGTFNVQGSGAASIGIGSNQSLDGFWLQKAGGVLQAGIDSSGVTKILIDEVDGDGDQAVVFDSGSLLDVDYLDGYSGAGTWTVLELENGDIQDNGLAFVPGVDTGIWSFAVDNSGTNAILSVTAIPEPVTAGLVVGAFGGLVAIRRFFCI